MKPILIIKVPCSVMMSDFHKVSESVKRHSVIDDYHVLVVKSDSEQDFTFQGLFPKDFDSKSFEELKAELKERLIVVE